MAKTATKEKQSKALVLSSVTLPSEINAKISAPTPKEFVKTKPGRGGKQLKYVEAGYVIAKLNEIFGRLNWDFKVIERGETNRAIDKASTGEVWVYGELSIKDHVKGFIVTKGAYGQHPIHANVPYGDALKAAESDALKKAASLFGIALDVYWQQELIEDGGQQKPAVKNQPVSTAKKVQQQPEDLFLVAKNAINHESDPTVLRQYLDRVESHETFTDAQKHQLKKLINGKIK